MLTDALGLDIPCFQIASNIKTFVTSRLSAVPPTTEVVALTSALIKDFLFNVASTKMLTLY